MLMARSSADLISAVVSSLTPGVDLFLILPVTLKILVTILTNRLKLEYFDQRLCGSGLGIVV